MKKSLLVLLALSVLFVFNANAQNLPKPLGEIGFSSVTNLNPMATSSITADKPQSKVWTYAGKFWTVLPTADGTFLWRLDGTTWTKLLYMSSGALAQADVKVVGSVVHILLYRGNNNSFLFSLEYDATASTYKLWSQRPERASFLLGPGGETATLDIDRTGRMWIAYDTPGEVNVRWSDSPYASWGEPLVLASGIADDDICSVIALPHENKVAVIWSNQLTGHFGMKTHVSGNSSTLWSADEKPASQSALNVGTGFSDDHMNMALGTDGSLYCAVKTSYDAPGYTKLALLIRRPNGVWDNVHEVSQFEGTRPIVLLNEAIGKIRIVYTSVERGGDILYRESSLSSISFGDPIFLLKGMYNYISSTKANNTSETVIIATDVTSTAWKVVGFLVKDLPSTVTATKDEVQENGDLIISPNPFSQKATLRFSLAQNSDYSAMLYDSKGASLKEIGKGRATKGSVIKLDVDGTSLSPGLYFIRLTTETGVRTIRLVHFKN